MTIIFIKEVGISIKQANIKTYEVISIMIQSAKFVKALLPHNKKSITIIKIFI